MNNIMQAILIQLLYMPLDLVSIVFFTFSYNSKKKMNPFVMYENNLLERCKGGFKVIQMCDL